MLHIAVVWHSATGTTTKLAQAMIEGISELKGVKVSSVEIKGSDIAQGRYRNTRLLDVLDDADAVIFGSPTFMGSVSAQFKAFADASSDKWADKAWADKLAAGFTVGSNLSGDQLHTIQYLQVFANQHGMLWVSLDLPGGYDAENRNRLGAQSGLITHSADGELHSSDLITARYLGQRVAKLAQRLVPAD